MRLLLVVIFAVSLPACSAREPATADDAGATEQEGASADDPCGPTDDLEQGANTASEAIKTGGTTAFEGTKAVVNTVGGWLEGGSDEANKQWHEGAGETDATARKGGKKTKKAAKTRPCKAK